MATDPTQELPLDQPDPQSLTAVPIEEAVPLIEPEEQATTEGEEVAVLGSISRLSNALKMSDDTVTPKQDVPPSEIIGGQIVINPADEATATRFRDLLNIAPGAEIKIPMPNLKNMNMEDAHKQYVETLHRIWQDDIQVQRRHSRSMDQIIEDAQSIGWDEAAIELLSVKKGTAFNDVQLARAIWVRLNAMNHLDLLIREGRDDELLQFLPMAGAIEIQTTGALAEAGRTLAVASHAGRIGALDTSRISSIPEMLKRYGGTPDDLDNFKAAYMALPVEGGSRARYMKTIWQKGLDVWAEAFINSLLSSPVTHAVNILSNKVFGAIQIPERALAGAIGSIRTNFFGGLGGSERVYMSEAWAQLRSLGRGLHIASKAAYKAGRHEEGTFGKGSSKVDTRQDKAISSGYLGLNPKSSLGRTIDAMGIAVRALGSRMLLVEDEFAKGVAYRMELEALADRRMHRIIEEGGTEEQAVLEGARILSGQDAVAVKGAEDFAVRTTFQGDLGKIGKYVQGAFSHPLTKVIVPFFKTPTNIVRETMARSPLAWLPGTGFWTDIKAGGASADLAMSKFMLGSGAFSLTAMIATGEMVDGIRITGKGPEDPEARKAWRRSGMQEYSIAFQGADGKWTSWQYGRLAPIAGILAMAADYAHYSQYEDDDGKLEQLFMAAGLGMFEQLNQLPMLQGVFEMAELAGSEYETGDDKAKRFAELMIKKFGGAIMTSVPLAPTGSLSATVERVFDSDATNVKPTTEQTENEYYVGSVARGWYEALNRAKSRIPFFNSDLPPKLNLWGETMKQCQNGAWCFISPIRVIESKYSPVDEEMVRLGLGLRMPRRTQRGIELTSDQYNQMIIDINLYGEESMMDEMMEMIDSDVYQESGIGEKLELLRNIMGFRKDKVLDEMFSQDSILGMKKEYRETSIEESGVAPPQ